MTSENRQRSSLVLTRRRGCIIPRLQFGKLTLAHGERAANRSLQGMSLEPALAAQARGPGRTCQPPASEEARRFLQAPASPTCNHPKSSSTWVDAETAAVGAGSDARACCSQQLARLLSCRVLLKRGWNESGKKKEDSHTWRGK